MAAKKAARPDWEFEANYFTWCNCDWGCPCNFNARPTEGHCHGGGVWRITRGRFGATKLDRLKFAVFYWFPRLVEQGNGRARNYVDRKATPEQRNALEHILSGKAGGASSKSSRASFRSGIRSWPRTSSSSSTGPRRGRRLGT